ncbi:MAG: TetR/AcrR family transcriptional regulator [Peptostreptococcaceae bacterium]|jgi:AcrR family transcriptional regulator|nr:TetR/AcrR family transcriptional regulator [Peptostreptococcaceae bacterium]
MPKIIKDLEEKIYINAFSLFCEKGYKKTSMKDISKNTNIAVGTLYNYYNSKENLFFEILKESWTNTFKKLDYILEQENNIDKKIKEFFKTLFLELKNRKGLGKELFEHNVIDKEDMDNLNKKIIDLTLLLIDKKEEYNYKFLLLEKQKLYFVKSLLISSLHLTFEEENLDDILNYLVDVFNISFKEVI